MRPAANGAGARQSLGIGIWSMSDSANRSSRTIYAAALWMVGVVLSFNIMAVSGRELSASLDTLQILAWRSIVGMIIMAAVLTGAGWGHARTARPGAHFRRNALHFAAQFGWFFGLSQIPLAQVFAIEFTGPIWALVFATVLLSERLTRSRLITVLLGFAGVLVILRPGITEIEIGQIAVLGAAAAYGMIFVLTKDLGRTEAPLTILFYMTVMQLGFGLIASAPNWAWPTIDDAPWLLVVGSSALSAHYCLTKALRLVDATVAVPFNFLRLPVAIAVGYTLYGEPIDIWVLLGSALIFSGILLGMRTERRDALTLGDR